MLSAANASQIGTESLQSWGTRPSHRYKAKLIFQCSVDKKRFNHFQVAQAEQVKVTGVAGAYTRTFEDMEEKLQEVRDIKSKVLFIVVYSLFISFLGQRHPDQRFSVQWWVGGCSDWDRSNLRRSWGHNVESGCVGQWLGKHQAITPAGEYQGNIDFFNSWIYRAFAAEIMCVKFCV